MNIFAVFVRFLFYDLPKAAEVIMLLCVTGPPLNNLGREKIVIFRHSSSIK